MAQKRRFFVKTRGSLREFDVEEHGGLYVPRQRKGISLRPKPELPEPFVIDDVKMVTGDNEILEGELAVRTGKSLFRVHPREGEKPAFTDKPVLGGLERGVLKSLQGAAEITAAHPGHYPGVDFKGVAEALSPESTLTEGSSSMEEILVHTSGLTPLDRAFIATMADEKLRFPQTDSEKQFLIRLRNEVLQQNRDEQY